MAQEKIQPSRAEWSEFSQNIQTDVNERLADLALEIEVINHQLNDSSKSVEEINKMCRYAVEFLDSKWAYEDDVFMVAGTWHYPEDVKIGEEGIVFRYEKKEAFRSASSNGFMVKNIDTINGKELRIGLSFAVVNQTVSTASFRGEIKQLAFAEPHEVTIQYMRPGSNEVVSTSLEDITRTLTTSDAKIQDYLSNGEAPFYRQSAKRQSAFLQDIIDSIEQVLPAPDSLDRLRIINSSTSHIYFKDLKSGQVLSCNLPPGEPPFRINGDVMEATFLDIVKNGHNITYRSPDDMKTSTTGVCLIVRPELFNYPLEEYGNPDIIIPVRAINPRDLSLI